MFRIRLRFAAVVVLVALATPSWAAAKPPRAGSSISLPTLFARVWVVLAHPWQKNGPILDPYGGKSGPGLDPYGQCGECQGASPPAETAPSGENGISADPNGSRGSGS